MKASFEKKVFHFKQPSGTSRGVLHEKHAWFISITDKDKTGLGECSIIPGLSMDFTDFDQYEEKLDEICDNIVYYADHLEELSLYPSILFGIETALLNLGLNSQMLYFSNDFSEGKMKIPINGLVWMGDKDFMLDQVHHKINQGFSCIKIKVGAINFEEECELISSVRDTFPKENIEIRLDANGAFTKENVMHKLKCLSKFHIHSIEQPIKQGDWDLMRLIVKKSPIPIALDEELIGVSSLEEKKKLLQSIRPHYIIIKPSLHGGLVGSTEWIALAQEFDIKWWITSALESNVGLSAIAQFVSEFKNDLPQGLGTGSLYTNNVESNLKVDQGFIYTLK